MADSDTETIILRSKMLHLALDNLTLTYASSIEQHVESDRDYNNNAPVVEPHKGLLTVTFHLRCVSFADFSVNSKSMSMKFYKLSVQVLRRLP